ncbi:DUF4179 domain-containing protein [Romboutsia sp. CE17]|uniref:DUF4179 domain-containing protein n=1 Tax=Romboutsia sp. CE17 TaxID=2724150 RepID=UPI001442C8D2|nr:DUF4179 domain-containing protein [Romboutsia sp. CE17]QJA09077.1 DUF4179 domain-containing protein [Romboutsia sp. CE17]
MNKFNDIKIPDNINEITKIAINKGKKHKKSNKYRKTMIASVASLGVILTLGINNPSLAYNIPVLGDIFDKINYALKNKESFKDNISDINASSEYNGLTITIDKAIYDGNNVYIDYIIKTEEPFKETIYANTLHEYEIDKDCGEMVYYFNQYYPEFKINGVKPNGYGADTPRVKYVDEYTLKGSAMYNFDVINQVKSDTIDFEMEFGLYSNDVDENGNSKMLDGKWAFNFPISSNKDDTKVINVNQTKNDFTLNQILLTPMSLSIDITAPNQYYKELDVMESIEVRDNNGHVLWATTGNFENYEDIENKEVLDIRYKQRYDLVEIGDNLEYVNIIIYGKWNEETKSAPILSDFKIEFNK